MTQLLDSLEERLYSLERLICAVCLLVMLSTVVLSVLVRTFNWPVPNVGEWALAAMSPLAFVGAAMCAKKRAHIAVDVIEQINKLWVKRLSDFLIALSMFAFAVVYAWLGWSLFEDAVYTGEKWLDMGTPIYVPIFFFAAGMAAMAFHGLCDLCRLVASVLVGNKQPRES